MKHFPAFLKKYFWDTEFKNIKIREHKRYVAERILEYGDIYALKWLLSNIGKETIKQILLQGRGLSPRSADFWALYFDIPRDKVLCLKKSYLKMRKSHWPY